MAFTFQGQLSVSSRCRTFRVTKHQKNDRKLLKILSIDENRCRTIHELAGTIDISYGVCQEILTEYLNMHHIAAKFVP
jgi:hypothetical protein